MMLYLLKIASAYILYLENVCKPNLMSTIFVNRKVFFMVMRLKMTHSFMLTCALRPHEYQETLNK